MKNFLLYLLFVTQISTCMEIDQSYLLQLPDELQLQIIKSTVDVSMQSNIEKICEFFKILENLILTNKKFMHIMKHEFLKSVKGEFFLPTETNIKNLCQVICIKYRLDSNKLEFSRFLLELGLTDLLKIFIKNCNLKKEEIDELPATLLVSINKHKKFKYKLMNCLLDFGCNPNSLYENDKPIFMITANKGYKKIMKLLLSKGADINIKDHSGWTTLMQMIFVRNSDYVKFLLDHKADINIRSNGGQTAREIAQRQSFPLEEHLA